VERSSGVVARSAALPWKLTQLFSPGVWRGDAEDMPQNQSFGLLGSTIIAVEEQFFVYFSPLKEKAVEGSSYCPWVSGMLYRNRCVLLGKAAALMSFCCSLAVCLGKLRWWWLPPPPPD